MTSARAGRLVGSLLAAALVAAVATRRAELLVRPWFTWVLLATAALIAALVVRSRIRLTATSTALLLLPLAIGATLTPALAGRASSGVAPTAALGARIGDGANPLLEGRGGNVTLLQILLAEQQVGGVPLAGRSVQVEAIAADTHLLNRSVIVCCAADAQTIALPEQGPALGPRGHWVRVTGHLAEVGTRVVLVATAVAPIPTPAEPFL